MSISLCRMSNTVVQFRAVGDDGFAGFQIDLNVEFIAELFQFFAESI